MIGFISFIGLIIVTLSSIFASINLIEDFNYPTWIGIFTGITSLALTVFYTNRDDRKEKESLTSLEKIETSIKEIKEDIKTIKEFQQSQNERIDQIEQEMTIHRKNLSSTNILSININTRKRE